MKKTVLTVLIFLSFAPLCRADITSNLLLWHKLDDGSGTAATDSSGNGNTGTLLNTPSWVAGKIGPYALGLIGSSQQADFVNSNIGYTTNTSLTIAGWAYRASSGDHGAFVKFGNVADGFGIGITNGGGSGFETSGNTLSVLYEAIRWVDTSQNFGTGWHHFALVVDASGKPTIYYDGTNIYTDSGTNGANVGSAGSASVNIGGYTSGIPSNRFYTGNLDDVRIYNRALSSADITELYNYTAPSSVVLRSFKVTLGRLFKVTLGKYFSRKY